MCSVKTWLLISSLLVVVMVWIGGVTRLTNSGLSITEWKPITGIIPPISEQDWLQEKLKYENTPEYQKINFDISMKEFKKIYIIEYSHRLFGRLLSMIFLVPLIYFLVTKRLSKRTIILTTITLLLGLAQGFMGWYMVKSGLVNNPYVSHYRLSAHLLLATFIFSILLWEASSSERKIIGANNHVTIIAIVLIILQIGLGGLVAGLKAGLVYNTFPLMDGELIPSGLISLSPWWKNIFENITTVQFVHRLMGLIILTYSVFISYRNLNFFTVTILVIVLVQVILGVLTLLYQIPIVSASLHQIFAFAVLGSFILYRRRLA